MAVAANDGWSETRMALGFNEEEETTKAGHVFVSVCVSPPYLQISGFRAENFKSQEPVLVCAAATSVLRLPCCVPTGSFCTSHVSRQCWMAPLLSAWWRQTHSNTWTTCLYGWFKAPTKRLKNILRCVCHLWRFPYLHLFIKSTILCFKCPNRLQKFTSRCFRLKSSCWSRTSRRLKTTCPGSWLMLSRWVLCHRAHQLSCLPHVFLCIKIMVSI